MQNRSAFDDITLDASADDDEDGDVEESKGDDDAAQNNGDEEQKEDDDEDEPEFVYDRALYDADGLDEDEDVDFDDDDWMTRWARNNFMQINKHNEHQN